MPTPNYKLKLTLGDKQYQSKGKTLFEAIDGLEPIRLFKTKGLLTVTHGKLKGERLMPIPQMKRFLSGGRLAKEVLAKHMQLVMKPC